MGETRLFTIGFAGKSAEQFFGLLRGAGVRTVIDIRRNNRSQMAGFTKRGDLGYFLQAILGVQYVHRLDLAPTAELLEDYRGKRIDWDRFDREYRELIAARGVERAITREELHRACLLCSEPSAERCHRRLLAEYLRETLGGISVCHL
jgi:uncharacterized protein (DUF488 family)